MRGVYKSQGLELKVVNLVRGVYKSKVSDPHALRIVWQLEQELSTKTYNDLKHDTTWDMGALTMVLCKSP